MTSSSSRPRAIVYVDGFNLYYGALKGTLNKWLNLQRFFELLRNEDELIEINYFTTRVMNPGPRDDQAIYLKALSTLPLVNIIEGRFKPKRLRCLVSECRLAGERTFLRFEEKRTDVNIAVSMLQDAYADRCERFVLVSGDSDLVPALNAIKTTFPEKQLLVYVPALNPQRNHAAELRGAADKARTLPLALLRRAQFPAAIPYGDGALTKPADW